MTTEKPKTTSPILDILWHVPLALIHLPATLTHHLTFKKTKFEEKLWKNKHILSTTLNQVSVSKEVSNFILDEVVDFKDRYKDVCSSTLEASCHYFLENWSKSADSNSTLVLRYGHWFHDVMCRELLRVSPLRYIWNESEKWFLLGIISIVLYMLSSITNTILWDFFPVYICSNICYFIELCYFSLGTKQNPVSKLGVNKH